MMLSVTRPLEQAVMEVPGIRRVRSTTFRGATEISAQFEPATDMIVALQQVQGKIDDARQTLPAGTDLDRRAAHARRVSDVHPQPDRLRVRRPICTTTRFYVMRPRLARVPGAGQVEVSAERHARDRGRRPIRRGCSRPD